MMKRNQHRMCPDVQAAAASPRETDHLDSVSELVGHRDIQIADSGYALPVNHARIHKPAESERRQYGDLVGYVESLNIVGWICLGEPQVLCGRQRLVKARA